MPGVEHEDRPTDIDLLKTFLEVNKTRHFGKAADNLYLTSAAISARIKLLEQVLGAPLFIRGRGNVHLTPEGERLLPHAEALVLTWQRTLQEISLQPEMTGRLHIGATSGLWQMTMQRKLTELRHTLAGIAIQAEAHTDTDLSRKLDDGTLDLVLLYDPPRLEHLRAVEIGYLDLVLASTSPDTDTDCALGDGYIYCDWGTAFSVFHARHFHDAPPPSLHVNLLAIAISHLAENPGATFVPKSVLEGLDYLYPVNPSPNFRRKIFAAFREGGDQPELVTRSIEILKGISV